MVNSLELKKTANNIRKNIINIGNKSASAHFGGSLSSVDILTYIFSIMNFDTKNMVNNDRDRFILSKGHCALGLYSALFEFGLITEDDLLSFNQDTKDFPTHCVQNIKKGIEVSSGSLGLGLSLGLGKAIALKKRNINKRVFVLAGNGELNEGSLWESIMFAGHKQLDNITLIVDDNGMQNDGASLNVMPVINWSEKLKVFNWQVVDVNGHDFEEMAKAFNISYEGKPLAIVAHTVKGKGISFMENNGKWHHGKLSEEEYQTAISDLEGAV